MAGRIDNDFYDIRIVELAKVLDACRSRGHLGLLESVGDGVDHCGFDQRLVSLNVYHRIARASSGDFRDAVRTTGMVRRGHLHAAEFMRDFPDTRVICGDDDFCE